MERVFFIPVVVEVCGCRHLGLVANPPELLISSASSRLIHPPPAGSDAALVYEMHRSAFFCFVFSDLFLQEEGLSRSRKKRPHCLPFQFSQSQINEIQTSIRSHCARLQQNVLPVWLKPATIVSVPAVGAIQVTCPRTGLIMSGYRPLAIPACDWKMKCFSRRIQ